MGRTERNGQLGSLRVAGRYRLVDKLGTGGMSEVWRAYDETLGRSVAVKVLSPQLAGDQAFRFDFGESPLDKRLTVPYVVMELNDGESVSARIARQGPMPWRDAVTMSVEVASALATAHAHGVVHRDITPVNVMLTGAGAKVVDFGISAIVGQRDAAPDGSLLGTPAYLAPERLGGSQVSAATDVYALGLLLYRSLSGRHPWPAENTTEALRAHLYADPNPLPAIAGLPPEVAELCLRCLTKNPADRPSSAEVARGLAATVGVQPIIPPVVERADDAPETARGTAAPPAVVPRRRAGLVRWALRYLGLPGGVPGPRPAARVLRLRAGLRIGAALRLGAARPLGGGLFAGGRVGGGLLTGDAFGFPRGRHRVPATVMTLAVVATAGISWATSRDVPDVREAQAAGAGVVAAGPPSDDSRCAVRYQLRRDSGRDYEAQLTVTTTEDLARGPWRVRFSYPGTQKLTGTSPAITQKGREVIAKGNGALRSFTLRGKYSGDNPLPLAFVVDDVECRAEVLAVTPASRQDDRGRSSRNRAPRTETAEVSETNGDKMNGDETRRDRSSRKNGTPQKRIGSTPPPATATPILRPPGLSLAL